MGEKLKSFFSAHGKKLLLAAPFAVVLALVLWPSSDPEDRSMSEIQTMISQREVKEAQLFDAQHRIEVRTDKGSFRSNFLAEMGNELVAQLHDAGVNYKVDSDEQNWLVRNIGTILLCTLFGFILLGRFLFARSGSLLDGVLGNTDYEAQQPKERFKDVMGADEAIANLKVVLDFLRNPAKYVHVKIERGILFIGPTGTGKTLLARALAGEAGVRFYQLSGAGLTSMFAGGTTERIDRFFKKLEKEIEPSQAVVVFIDELDGIATRRAGDSRADRDKNTAVTHLLQKVTDFLASHPYAILVGATNRIEALDKAVIRSGRFGLHIAMPNPDQAGRKAILDINSDGVEVHDSVDLSHVATLTAGMSGADVAGIPGRASVLAAQQNSDSIVVTQRLLEQAAMEMVMGTLRHSAYVCPEDLKIYGIHESGHAVIAHLSPYHWLLVVTTIPISDSGGSTWCPAKDRGVMDREGVIWDLMISLGGREAELLDQGCTSSGPSHDIQRATALARTAVCQWGISDNFLEYVNPHHWEEHPRANVIDREVRSLIKEAQEKTRELLRNYEGLRKRLQGELAEKRILHSDELAEIIADKKVLAQPQVQLSLDIMV